MDILMRFRSQLHNEWNLNDPVRSLLARGILRLSPRSNLCTLDLEELCGADVPSMCPVARVAENTHRDEVPANV